jgi:hypothetical protein
VSAVDDRSWTESDKLARERIEAERAFAARTPPSHGVVWWASVIAVIALGTIVFAFAYSYFYLRLGADQWPLEGTDLRPWELPAVALGCVAAALVVGPQATRGRLPIAVACLLAATGLVAQIVALANAGYSVDANAYEALVITMDGIGVTLLATAVGVRVAAVSFEWPRLGPNALHEADAAFFVGLASIWIALWAVIHLAPRLL